VELTETLRRAVNRECSCGGSGPDDPLCCPACRIWHAVTGTLRISPEGRDPSLAWLRLGIFSDWVLPTDEDLRFVAEKLRMDDLILGFNVKEYSGKGWKPKYPVRRVKERIRACRDAGLKPIVMTWAIRSEKAIVEMCEWIQSVIDSNTEILLDAEADWHRGNGINAVDAAYLVTNKLRDRRVGVTGLGQLQDTVRPLASRASFCVPQAYSFWSPIGGHWSQSPSTFPGPQQDQAFKTWSSAGPAQIIMALGCYWGNRPASKMTPKLQVSQTMRFAAIETASLGVSTVWYWSLKWARAKTAAGREVREFFGVKE